MERALGADYQVITAADPGTAIEKAFGEPRPDLILLDIDMPDISGFEVCRALKDEAVTASIPIIFLTGRTEAQAQVEALELGAVDYISKTGTNAAVLKLRVGAASRARQPARRARAPGAGAHRRGRAHPRRADQAPRARARVPREPGGGQPRDAPGPLREADRAGLGRQARGGRDDAEGGAAARHRQARRAGGNPAQAREAVGAGLGARQAPPASSAPTSSASTTTRCSSSRASSRSRTTSTTTAPAIRRDSRARRFPGAAG